MFFSSPKFWNQLESPLATLLKPLSWLYQAGLMIRKACQRPYRVSVPVISIGNIVLGGAGKTPVTIALAEILQTMGHVPHVISRGYGGSLQGPVRVDPIIHTYQEVGDEPLFIARTVATWVSKNRYNAADLAIQAGADVLLLDDAHQNTSLKKDISFLVVNSAQGFGNGHVFPAGPLRQSLRAGLKHTTAVILISDDDRTPEELQAISCPLVKAKIVPITPQPCPIVGFTGLGYPEKFHQTLLKSGYQVKDFIPFPDHYPYQEKDLKRLKDSAQKHKVPLITTEKDWVRIPIPYHQGILTLPIRLVFQNEKMVRDLLKFEVGLCYKRS